MYHQTSSHCHQHMSFIMNEKQIVFQTGPTKSELYKHRSWLEAENFGFREYYLYNINIVTAETDMRLYFSIYRVLDFSCDGSYLISKVGIHNLEL